MLTVSVTTETIKTPNIDRLAEEGARLLHDFHPDSVCTLTPNRAALMTRRYLFRSGSASDRNEYRMFLRISSSGGLPQGEPLQRFVSASRNKTDER